ncbi:hypothetical protein ATANTOWER_000386 [Ataeniobius toweri]|uniref:Uncharacterized protein n=1 Tax=Ataeniobius toweri TaxID=208326 RepID=A0ABU7CDN8_9TELE|nr:hypothetical protein [Ataeniobius toweri]
MGGISLSPPLLLTRSIRWQQSNGPASLHRKRSRGEKSIGITTEKVALMPGIAAYVYTKSGNLSSYGHCDVRGWRGGGQGSPHQPPLSNYCCCLGGGSRY